MIIICFNLRARLLYELDTTHFCCANFPRYFSCEFSLAVRAHRNNGFVEHSILWRKEHRYKYILLTAFQRTTNNRQVCWNTLEFKGTNIKTMKSA